MSKQATSAKSRGSIFNMKVRARLIAGFAAVCTVLAVVVGVTILDVGKITARVDRIDRLRVPTSFASGNMTEDIQASLASLRGWMLTGNPAFKAERALVWADIDRQSAAMDKLSKNWTNPENIRVWAEFKVILAEFRIAQQRVEAIAHTIDEQPPNKMLFT